MIHFTKAKGRLVPLRKAKGDKKAALDKLRSFLTAAEPEAVEIVYSALQGQSNAITYKELREAYLAGGITDAQFMQWEMDYSKLITTTLAPQWQAAAAAGAQQVKDKYPHFLYEPSVSAGMAFIKQHGAELVTNIAAEQRAAINALIAHVSGYTAVTPDEAARIIRPCVGLTKPQALANARYREAVKQAFIKANPKSRLSTAEKRANEAAAKYAARQHRYRAQNIARTELAFAYNAGHYGATKDAQAQGYIGDCVKIWLTAFDERVCPHCAEMDDEKKNMDEAFSNGKLLPPHHPSCRCAVAYEEIPGTAAITPAQPGNSPLTSTQQQGTMGTGNAAAQGQQNQQIVPVDPRQRVTDLENQYNTLRYQHTQATNPANFLLQPPTNADLAQIKQLEQELSRVHGELAEARLALLRMGSTTRVQFKTLQEAEEFCQNILNLNAKFTGCSVTAVNSWVQGLVDMQEVFPDLVRNNLRFVGECHERNKIAWDAYYQHQLQKSKQMNPRLKPADHEKLAKKKADDYVKKNLKIAPGVMAESWSPVYPLEDCRGICMNNQFFGNSRKAAASLKDQVSRQWHPVACDTTKAVFDHEFGHQLDKWLGIQSETDVAAIFSGASAADMKAGLSEYGATNLNEMVAEAWSEYCNNPNPRPIAQKVGETVERKYIEWAKKNF